MSVIVLYDFDEEGDLVEEWPELPEDDEIARWEDMEDDMKRRNFDGETPENKWEKLQPAGVAEYQQWRKDVAVAVVKRQNPLTFAGPRPELSAEARAWITISDMMAAVNDHKYNVGKTAMMAAIDGMPLVEAAELAEKKWSDYLSDLALNQGDRR